jgi:hypothetical protein
VPENRATIKVRRSLMSMSSRGKLCLGTVPGLAGAVVDVSRIVTGPDLLLAAVAHGK